MHQSDTIGKVSFSERGSGYKVLNKDIKKFLQNELSDYDSLVVDLRFREACIWREFCGVRPMNAAYAH